jgi:hypothetical protein
MFDDMAVRHPISNIAHIYEHIYVLIFWNKYRIFPDKIGIYYAVLIQYEKSLAVHMKWVLHRVHAFWIICKSNFY